MEFIFWQRKVESKYRRKFYSMLDCDGYYGEKLSR